MTTSTTERLVAFFFVALAGTVWNSIGATAVVTPGSTAFDTVLQRQPLSIVQSKPMLQKDASFLQFRGGEMAAPEEGDDDNDDEEEEVVENNGLVATKLKNLIRNLLRIGDDKLPLLSGLLRTIFGTMESLTGMNLLPPAPEEKKKTKKKSKSEKKSSETSGNAKEESTDKKTKKKKPAKKNASSKKASAATSSSTSSTTKKHLATSIKSTNPNYRIQKELKAFLKSPPDNLSVQVGSNIRLWIVTIVGAKDTIYEGEVFKLRIEFPKDYPTVPPSVYFLKKHMPVHEHVYTNGDICLSLLGNGWRPTMSAQSIAVSILSILSSAQKKCLPMDNANHAGNKPGQYQKDWVYHDDNC